jgi:hypothetical protein
MTDNHNIVWSRQQFIFEGRDIIVWAETLNSNGGLVYADNISQHLRRLGSAQLWAMPQIINRYVQGFDKRSDPLYIPASFFGQRTLGVRLLRSGLCMLDKIQLHF